MSSTNKFTEIDFASVLEQLEQLESIPKPDYREPVGIKLKPKPAESIPQQQQPPRPELTGIPQLDQPLHRIILDTVQSIIPDFSAFDKFNALTADESKKKIAAAQSIVGKIGVLVAKIADEIAELFEKKSLISDSNGRVYYRV